MRRIYLDYNATTPIAPEARRDMQPFLAEHFGNPSSSHALGRCCGEAICDAREQVASLVAADAENLIFTGGGTESNNLALKGVFLRGDRPCQGHLIISRIEHPAVTEPARFLRDMGVDLTVVPCDARGRVDPDDIRRAIRSETRLVSVMLANNEIGTIQPVTDIARVAHDHGVPCHTDAAQALGKIVVDVNELGVDMLSVAGHKMYAPKGIGALFLRESVDLEPLLHGAPHEQGLRAGTENTPYIVALGTAAKLAVKRLSENAFDSEMRDQLWSRLQDAIPGLTCNGSPADGLPNTLSVNFPQVNGSELLSRVPEVCASTGAACHSGLTKISATLEAIGVPEQTARGAVRLTTGRYTTSDEVQYAAELLAEAWRQLAGQQGR